MENILIHPENAEQVKAIKSVLKLLNIPFKEQPDHASFPKITSADIEQALNDVKTGKYKAEESD